MINNIKPTVFFSFFLSRSILYYLYTSFFLFCFCFDKPLYNNGVISSSWKLPLKHDDELQPLYEGPPLPTCALEAGGVLDYKNANPKAMAKACRHAAGWKLASNGINVR